MYIWHNPNNTNRPDGRPATMQDDIYLTVGGGYPYNGLYGEALLERGT